MTSEEYASPARSKPPRVSDGEKEVLATLERGDGLCTEEDVEKNNDEDIPSGVPVDRGWAWVICCCAFLITFIMSVYDQVLAVMFVDVIDRFQISGTVASVAFTIHAVTQSLGSFISTNVLIPRFGDRVVIAVAAVVNSLSTVLLAFSPNIVFFHAVHVVKGTSIGCMWIPAVSMIGFYFRRRRSVATALCNTGIGVALLSMPPLVRLLLDTFGFLSTLLLISTLEMHGIAVAMLMRPVSCYIRRARLSEGDYDYASVKGSSISTAPAGYDDLQKVPFVEGGAEEDSVDRAVVNGKTVALAERVFDDVHDDDDDDDHRELRREDDDSNRPLTESTDVGTDARSGSVLGTRSEFIDKVTSAAATNDISSITEAKCGPRGGLELGPSPGENNTDRNLNSSLKSNHVSDNFSGSLSYSCDGCGNEDSTANEFTQLQENEAVQKKNNNGFLSSLSRVFKDSACRRKLVQATSLFDMRLFSDWLFRLLVTSTAAGVLVLYIPAYIPTLAVNRNVDKPSAAMLLTICGGVNLVSLLLQGFIVDSKLITALNFIGISQVIVGTMCHLVHFFSSFPTLVLLSATYGMFGGARMSFMPVLAIDLLGVDNLSKALGFNAMVATFSLSLHHPFLSYLMESAGTFSVPFHYVGLALYVSSLLMFLEPVGRRWNNKKRSD